MKTTPFRSTISRLYHKLIRVDWREEERRILAAFIEATGLPADNAALEMDDKTQYYQLVGDSFRIDVPWGDNVSAQHSMLAALQQAFAATHSIRLLNRAVLGDTGCFLVETNETWRLLEEQNPHVRWFFTPIELLPDTFNSDTEILERIGTQYSDA